jgi:hypothetical protein
MQLVMALGVFRKCDRQLMCILLLNDTIVVKLCGQIHATVD